MFVCFDERNTLLLDKCIPFWYEVNTHIIEYRRVYSPASRDIPSRPATTQEAPHIEHKRRSFPSLIHPHLDAATASICSGLFAYVASLKVERRDRNDATDDGLYSVFEEKVESEDACLSDRNENKFFVRVEARERMAVK